MNGTTGTSPSDAHAEGPCSVRSQWPAAPVSAEGHFQRVMLS